MRDGDEIAYVFDEATGQLDAVDGIELSERRIDVSATIGIVDELDRNQSRIPVGVVIFRLERLYGVSSYSQTAQIRPQRLLFLAVIYGVNYDAARRISFDQSLDIAQHLGQIMTADTFGLVFVHGIERNADARKVALYFFGVEMAAVGNRIRDVTALDDHFDHSPESPMHDRFAFALERKRVATRWQLRQNLRKHLPRYVFLRHIASGAVETGEIAVCCDFDLNE